MSERSDNEQFARLLVAVEPWLENVVIIGGWAYRLYRLHPNAQSVPYPALATLDTDIALPARLKAAGTDLRQRLLATGFLEERLGADEPPATHYRLVGAKDGFYAEFLTPLFGGEYGRDAKRKATRRIAGVVSQQLRYLEMLLLKPWVVSLGKSNGFAFEAPKEVRIPNPATFVAHKLLIYGERRHREFAKDILYIHDTLEVFGARLEDLETEWRVEVAPKIHANSVRKIRLAAKDLFGKVHDAIREAARMSGARKISPESVRERCNFGLARIFS